MTEENERLLWVVDAWEGRLDRASRVSKGYRVIRQRPGQPLEWANEALFETAEDARKLAGLLNSLHSAWCRG
jgi:hypothetical protein